MRRSLVLLWMIAASLTLMATTIRLDILTQPSGGNVIVNDVWRGNAPVSVMVNPGLHKIEANHHGYISQSTEVEVSLPQVIEFSMVPIPDVVERFPIALFLTNYKESGTRRVLDLEGADAVIEHLSNRLRVLGFPLFEKQPQDEWDLLLGPDLLIHSLQDEFPEGRLILLVDSQWSTAIFQQQKVNRLTMQLKVYDVREGVVLGTINEFAESVGLVSQQIALWQVVEKVTHKFMNMVGGYMIQLSLREEQNPVLIAKGPDFPVHWEINSPIPVRSVRLVDGNAEAAEYWVSSAPELQKTFLFLVDTSSKMADWLDPSKKLIESMITQLPENSQWAVMTFGDQIELVQSVTTRFDQWVSAKERIVGSGMSPMHDALYRASSYLSRIEGLRYIILLTDGIDHDYFDSSSGSRFTLSEAIHSLKTNRCILYPIGMTPSHYQQLLQEIGREFGTQYINAYRKDSVVLAQNWSDQVRLSTFVIQGYTKDEPRLMLGFNVYDVDESSRFLRLNPQITSLIPPERVPAEPTVEVDEEPIEEAVPVSTDKPLDLLVLDPAFFLAPPLSGLKLPEMYSEVFSSASIDLFDMDPYANILWTTDRILYYWIRDTQTLRWMEMGETILIAAIHEPYLFAQSGKTLHVYQIREDQDLDWIVAYPLDKRIVELQVMNHRVLVRLSDGTAESFHLTGRDLWKLEPSGHPISSLRLFDQGGLISTYASGLVNWWIPFHEGEPKSLSHQRSIAGAFSFKADPGQFIMIDSSGEIYYQPLDGSLASSKRLNRGIVLDALFAEEEELMITIHWDGTVRAFQVNDLHERFQITYPLGFLMIKTDRWAKSALVQTVDGYTVYFSLEATSIPELADHPTVIHPNLRPIPDEHHTLIPIAPKPDPDKPLVPDPETSLVPDPDKPLVPDPETSLVPDPDKPLVPDPEDSIEEQFLIDPVSFQNEPSFRVFYGGYDMAMPFREHGFVLARPGEVSFTNTMLEQQLSFPIRNRRIVDMDISGEDFLVILYDDRIELIDLITSIKVERIQVIANTPLEGAQKIRFTTDSQRIVVVQDREILWYSRSLDQLLSYEHSSKITTWAVPYDRMRSLVFGDETGAIGFVDEGGINNVQRVSNQPILSVSWYNWDIYWITQSRLGRGTRATIPLEGVVPIALYSGDFGKNWVVLGTGDGELLIYNSSLELAGRATASVNPIKLIRGWAGKMISMDRQGELKTWDLGSGISAATRVGLAGSMGIFLKDAQIQVLFESGQRIQIHPQTLRVTATMIRNLRNPIQDFSYHPPMYQVQDEWFPHTANGISDTPIRTWIGSGLSACSPWIVTWSEDNVQVMSAETLRVERTFKFGEGNDVSFAKMVGETLVFFFRNSMGMVQAFEPGQVLVMNISEHSLGPVRTVFGYQDFIAIVGSQRIAYFSTERDEFERIIPWPFEIDSARYNPSRMTLYGWKDGTLLQFPLPSETVSVFKGESIVGLDWTDRHLYLLMESGMIWVQELDEI